MRNTNRRMKIARVARALTLADLAHRLGVHEAFLCRVEAGLRAPSPALARALERELGLCEGHIFPLVRFKEVGHGQTAEPGA